MLPVVVGANDELERIELVRVPVRASTGSNPSARCAAASCPFNRERSRGSPGAPKKQAFERLLEVVAIPAARGVLPLHVQQAAFDRLRRCPGGGPGTRSGARRGRRTTTLIGLRRGREPRGIGVIEHAPHEVRRHARAIVAAHAPQLHALLIERLHRDVGERRERAQAGERVRARCRPRWPGSASA